MMKPTSAILLVLAIFNTAGETLAQSVSGKSQAPPKIEGEHLPLCGTAHLAIAAQNFRSLWRQANLNAASGKFEEADYWFRQALQNFLTGPALQLHPIKEEVAVAYARMLRLEGGKTRLDEAARLEQEARPTLLRRQAELEKSLSGALAKSLQTGAGADDKYSTFVYRHLLANIDRGLGAYDKAEPLYKEALSEATSVGNGYDTGSLKQDYAVLLYCTGRADQARKLLSVPEPKS